MNIDILKIWLYKLNYDSKRGDIISLCALSEEPKWDVQQIYLEKVKSLTTVFPCIVSEETILF